MKNIFLIAIVALTFSSCAGYKMYHRPSVETEGVYRSEVTSDTTSIGNLQWKELFTDPQLQSLIEEGLKNNSDLRIAYLKVEEAKASLTAARLAYTPSLALNPQGTISSFDGAKASQTYQLSAAASWELDIFGKLTSGKNAAKMAVYSSDAYRQAVQTQLISTLANSYYALLMLDDQLSISKQTAINWRENVRVMSALKDAGQASEASVSQAKASLLSVEGSILTLERSINEMENSLSTLLGRAANNVTRGKLAGQQFPDQLAIGVPLQMLSNRPDVKQREYLLAQSFYYTNQARTAFYPNITLSGSAGWVNNAGSYIMNPGKLLLSALGSLTQPIFAKGQNRSRLNIAKAQQEEAKISFQQTILNAGAEVNNALVQWQTARQRLVIDAQQIDQLQIALKSTQLLMQHGNTNYLQVLTAQQTLLQAELTKVSDKYDEIQGVINLFHSLGGGR